MLIKEHIKFKISGTVNDSIVDGDGVRFTIFTQGCPHKCDGCHNPQTHDPEGGEWADVDKIFQKIKKNPLLDGVTFSGGEPFLWSYALAKLAAMVHSIGLNVITYTGFSFEELYKNASSDNHYMDLIKASDFIVDGRFLKDKKSYNLNFVGSSNQRIIDCRKSDFEHFNLVCLDIYA